MRIENGNLNVNGTTKINQLFDYVNSSGLTGQVLTSVPSGVQWNNIDSVITGSTTGKLNVSDFSIFTASTLPSTYFRQSGNTFGTTAILGTNDSQGLSLITAGQSRLFVTNVGNVGVGISTPTSPLFVYTNTSSTTIGDNNSFIIHNNNSGLTSNNITEMFFSDAGQGAGTANGLNLSHRYAGISAFVTGWNFLSSAGGMDFVTKATTGAALTSKLRINPNGDVGIGLTNPSFKLEVAGNIRVQDGGFLAGTISESEKITFSSISGLLYNVGSSERMRITTTGSVGIGTTSPTARLQVKGANATSSTTGLRVEDSNGISSLVVRDDRRVGLNTDNPTSQLHVSGSTRLDGSLIIGMGTFSYSLNPNDQFTITGNQGLILNHGNGNNGGVTLGSSASSDFSIPVSNASRNGVVISRPFNLISGSTNMNLRGLTINNVVNSTGSTNTNYTALLISPTVNPSVTTFRSIETQSGDVIFNGGNVGIGVQIPTAELHISGSSSSNPLLINTSGGTVALSVNNIGNVGVGTSTPTAKLQVRGAGDSSIWITSEDFNADTNTGTVVRLGTTNSTGNSNGTIDVLNSGLSSYGNLSLVRLGGNVGIGTTSPAFTLDVNGTARATTLLETSSQRYKTNIIPLPSQLDTINKLNPVTFNWKDETKGNGTQYGLIAEEVQEIIPDAVETNDNGTAEAISYTKLVPILIKAVQELQKEVNELKEKLNK